MFQILQACITQSDINWLDIVNILVQTIIAIGAIIGIFLSLKSLKEADWSSRMSTAPTLIIRPSSIDKGIGDLNGYGVLSAQDILQKLRVTKGLIFIIEFEVINVGKGTAFNISISKRTGMESFGRLYIPIFQTGEDEPIKFKTVITGSFDEFFNNADEGIPCEIALDYMNDQHNVFCRSIWQARVKPFEKDGNNLKVSEASFPDRLGKVEYSNKPY